MVENKILTMINNIVKDKLPQYVFGKKYESFRFVIFNEIFCNQILEFIKILFGLLKDEKATNLLCLEIEDANLALIKDFELEKSNYLDIANFFRDYEMDGVPYFALLAFNIIVIDSKESICIYGDRNYDVCIIGCSEYNFMRLRKEQTGIMFMDLNEYINYLKSISTKDISEIIMQLELNYSRT